MDEVRFRAAEQRLWQSVGLTVTEQQLRLARSGVTVRVQEVGEGAAVLLVHGGLNAGASWATLVARLEGFHCLMLDRPGCGLSDPHAGLDDFEQLAAFADTLIVDVLDALGLDSAHLIATSFGGYFALRSAAAHPERTDRVMELGYPVGANRMPLQIRLSGLPMVGRLLTALPLTDRSVRAMLRQIGLRQALEAGRISQEMIDWYLALLRDTDTMRNELSSGPRFPIRRMDDRALLPASLLASIVSPVQFLWGEEDPFGGADVARRFVAYLRTADLELMAGVGHAPWMDDPDHAATVTRRFLTA